MQIFPRTLCLALALIAGATASAQDIKERSLRLAYVTAKDSPYGVGVEKFSEVVARRSGGKIKVRGYADGVLGGEVPTISSAAGGVLEMSLVSTSATVGTLKEFALFDFPFLFSEEREVHAVLDGPVGTSLLDKLPAKGVVGLCYWEAGFRHVTNNKGPITRLEDLRGLKIRTIQSPVFVDVFNGLGANAVPMPFTELYTALESRAIDGQEGPYTVIYTSKFHEVQKYMSATKHIYVPGLVLVSKKHWDQMSGDEQKLLRESCAETRDFQRKAAADMTIQTMAQLRAKGMVLNDVPAAERARMRDRIQPVIQKYTREVGEDLVQRTLAEIARVRAK